MSTFTDESVLNGLHKQSPKRSPKKALWRYCLGLVAAIFTLSAADCTNSYLPIFVRDITAGIAPGDARVFATNDRQLAFRPDNTFSYWYTVPGFAHNDWVTGGTWEQVERAGDNHVRILIPKDLRATVANGADSMIAQVYKITWDKPASTRNPPRRRPETVLWLTNNQVLIARWGPSHFSQPGVNFDGRTLAGAKHLIPQTSPTE